MSTGSVLEASGDSSPKWCVCGHCANRHGKQMLQKEGVHNWPKKIYKILFGL